MNVTPPAPIPLVGEEVVLDLATPYVILGRLVGEDYRYLILEDADVHDLRDTSTTRELYVVDARRHGINANRLRVFVSREQIISISAFTDIIV